MRASLAGAVEVTSVRLAHGDGSVARWLAQLARLDLLAIDDFAISPMGLDERKDLFELLGVDHEPAAAQGVWYTHLSRPTVADATLDRVGRSSHKI